MPDRGHRDLWPIRDHSPTGTGPVWNTVLTGHVPVWNTTMDAKNVPTFADMTSPYTEYERGKDRERAVRAARKSRETRELALYARPDWVRPDYAGEATDAKGGAR